MRSRNGNKNFLLSISIAILFFSLALDAREYLISYRYLVKNFILYNETLNISPAMLPCKGESYNPFLLDTEDTKDLKTIIRHNKEKFIDYIQTLGLNITHEDKTSNFIYSDTTIITLKSRCFKVDFNDNFVKISPLK